MSRKYSFIKGSSVFCQLIIENPWLVFIASLYYVVVCERQAGLSLARLQSFALLEIERTCSIGSNQLTKVAVVSPLLKLFDY